MTRTHITFSIMGLLFVLLALALIASPGTSAAGGFLPTVTPAGGAPANDLIVFLANDDGEYMDTAGNFTFLDGGWDIYAIRLDGSDFQRLTDTPEDENNPVLSLDGTHIAFLRWTDDMMSPLYVMDVDGSNIRQLAGADEQRSAITWSPDSTRIAYNVLIGTPAGVVVIDVASGARTVLAEMDYMGGYPVWSPDGVWIACAGFKDGNEDVYVVNADGTDLRRLSKHPASEHGPHWFPDGETLWFTRWDDGTTYLTVPVTGEDGPQLAERALGPFSPDGTQLVTIEREDDVYRLVIYDADGTNPREVLTTTDVILAPRWSSDGAQIVYFSSGSDRNDFHYDLYVIDAAGGATRRLTFTNSAVTGYAMFP